ncbi:MAG TPA: hypothetical protein VFS21_06090 [Roseiflexaceae bacterium]|nr:hypothetical protein [Roseiflexaceae bacterium]
MKELQLAINISDLACLPSEQMDLLLPLVQLGRQGVFMATRRWDGGAARVLSTVSTAQLAAALAAVRQAGFGPGMLRLYYCADGETWHRLRD